MNECVDSRAFRHLCFFDDETLQNCAGPFLNLFWNVVDELERNRRRKRIDKSRPCNQLSDRRCVEAQGVRKRRWTFVASNVEPTVQAMDDMPLSSALELDKVSHTTTSQTNAWPRRRAIAAGRAHAGHPTDSSESSL